MSTSPTLHVVSQRTWVAEELSGTDLATVRQSYGLDIPEHHPDDSWWMPAEQAARMLRSGVDLRLTAPGPKFLSSCVGPEFLGRTVHTCRVKNLKRSIGWNHKTAEPIFAKPAEAKVETVPARIYWDDHFTERAVAALPGDSWIQWTPTLLDLAVEYRFYVRSHRVVAGSLYLVTDPNGVQTTYYDGARSSVVTGCDARDFAREVVAELSGKTGKRASQPDAYCLDVGWDRAQSRWVVVEANPAWCSAWYAATDPLRGRRDEVVKTILASCHGAEDSRWSWRPDAYLIERAERQRPLPRRCSDSRTAPATDVET